MHRLICRLGPVNLYSYGLMLALAFGIGTYIAAFRAQKRGIHRNVIYDLVLWILVSSLAGARLFFVALNLGYFRDHPSEILMVWEGGLVLYGGIIFGFAAAVWYLRRVKVPVWKAADIIAPSLALGVAIGRIGCFLNGCCYGKVSYKWGVCYPSAGSPPAYEEQVRHGLLSGADRCSLPVLPTQLYESLVCLALFGLLLWIGRKKPFFDGFLFWLFILLYSAQRFFMEGIRYYEENFLAGPFTVGQVI
ncbi:MAG: prolipoprotein diacylglyceryl transferase, partial [Deltaproteobacteria bacterium]